METADIMNAAILGYFILRYKSIYHIKIDITQYTTIRDYIHTLILSAFGMTN